MSAPSYDKLLSLADRFRQLLYGGKSPADAIVLLSELYYAFHFHINDPLPPDVLYSLVLALGPSDELEVRLPGGRWIDPEKTLTREPHMLEASPIPLDQYRWMSADPRQAERDALAELVIEPQEPKPSPAPVSESLAKRDPVPPEASDRKKGDPDIISSPGTGYGLPTAMPTQPAPKKPPPTPASEPEPEPDNQLVRHASGDNDASPQPKKRKRRRARLRQADWEQIKKHWSPIVKSRGRWPNAHAAAEEILKTQTNLTISFDAVYKGIPQHFPDWIEPEIKE
jgi:hypothetical protein